MAEPTFARTMLAVALTMLGSVSSVAQDVQRQAAIESEEPAVLSDVPMWMPEFTAGLDMSLVVVEVQLNEAGVVTDARALSGGKHIAPTAVHNVKGWLFEAGKARTAIVVYKFIINRATCISGVGYGTGAFSRSKNVATVRWCQPISQP